jgi:hypothetical protein
VPAVSLPPRLRLVLSSLIVLACAVAVLATRHASGSTEPGPQTGSTRAPNFIFILADDLGYAVDAMTREAVAFLRANGDRRFFPTSPPRFHTWRCKCLTPR